MNISEILDTMDDLLDEAWSIPFAGERSVVDLKKLRELIDDLRLNVPNEVKQAKLIVQDRNLIVEDARAEADKIIEKAKAQAEAMIMQDEITKQATAKANEILTTANTQAREVKAAASNFADDSLREVEEALLKSIQDVKATRAVVRKTQ